MPTETNGHPASGRVLIVSNRLPVTLRVDGGRTKVSRSSGGLATALAETHARAGGLWIGWAGQGEDVAVAAESDVGRQLAEMRLVPVHLGKREVETFYNHVSNEVLWPLCHDRLDYLPLRVTGWDVYERVNARFADVIAAHWRPGDMVWVHDYHLLRLPALVRERIPEARIGFFLHIPFPNPEIFFALSTRKWLVEGMLGADLIGFHTRRYRGHFTAALRRLFRVEMDPATESITYNGRRVRLGIFPISIDAAGISRRASAPAVLRRAAELRVGDEHLCVGIDRLDYSKGVLRRFLALERLLTEHPQWRERVRLVQVAVPSRETVGMYRRYRSELEALVGRINGAFATPMWSPIQYIRRSISDELLLSLYRAADALLVTPVRDGMNLVAKEFVASRTDDDGVLVLSEFAGAADELTDAMLVNPYDVDGIALAIHQALTISLDERRARMRAMRAQVATHDVHRWSASFLAALASA